VEAARLPNLDIISSTNLAALPGSAIDCDLALGDPSLLAQALPRLTLLRWIQATWAGVEPLLDPALRRDYVLTNARGVFGPQMSEYVFAYLLALERRILDKHRAQEAGPWDPTPPGALRGKQIGLLGVGTIGAALARTAKHFGMRVKGFTRASETCADVDAYFHGDLAKVHFAADLDYLVSIVPSTSATRRLVDAALLGALPPHAVFVNPRARVGGRRGGARRSAAHGPPGRCGARCVSNRAAASSARAVAHAERPRDVAHRRAQRAGRHRAALHRQLPAARLGAVVTVSRGFRGRVLTAGAATPSEALSEPLSDLVSVTRRPSRTRAP
jgi:hypothetical protein